MAGKSFSSHGNETSASTSVTDTIRKIDFEMARYSKLLGTLSSRIDATGLHVAEADLVAVLLRSLPDAVRTFCLHHTGGETYQAFRTTALRWEQQQRAFAEFHPKKSLYQVEIADENAQHYYMSAIDGDGDVLTRLKIQPQLTKKSKQGKSRDPNLRCETSETTACGNRRQGAWHQMSQKPLSHTIAPLYPSYHGASVGMAIIAQAFNRLTFIIMHQEDKPKNPLKLSSYRL